MAFWSRIKEAQIRVLSNGLKRCYFQIHNPSELPHSASSYAASRVLDKPSLIALTNRVEFLNGVRFFAAPVQAKPKEEKDTSGPRLNEKVTAAFVRLVTDEDHVVISRREALDRAKSLNLDLVEVDRNAKPPVCKIMDYHKEKYIRQVKEKEQAKKKSDLTLRKGAGKEVRFLGKTEQKDLKIKADTIKRMMDKGYRVKCMAMGNGSDNENLGEVLSRLSSLIEDVALIESGPHVEKKQAYIVVRHVKFGPLKKGSGKKASKVAAASSVDSQEQETDSDAADDGITVNEDVESKFDWRASDEVHSNVASRESGNITPRGQNRYARQPANRAATTSSQAPADRREPSNAGENRYRRETTTPVTGLRRAPPVGENRYRREQPQSNMNSSSPQIRNTDSQSLNKNGFNEQHSSQYGIFSAPQAESAAGKENAAVGVNRYKKENMVNSARYSSANP